MSDVITTFVNENGQVSVGVTMVFLGGTDPSGGITQAEGDARYVKKDQINAPNGVAGLNVNEILDEEQLPLPAVTLSTLFRNRLT